jgi:hypothetical protein
MSYARAWPHGDPTEPEDGDDEPSRRRALALASALERCGRKVQSVTAKLGYWLRGIAEALP